MKRLTFLILLLMVFGAANALAVSAETKRPSPRSAQAPTGEIFYVNSLQDHPNQPTFCDPSCTLRDAISIANDTPGHDTIYFDFDGPVSIRPKEPLPNITEPLTIDGTFFNDSHCPTASEPANLLITLSGDRAGVGATGLTFGAGSASSMVRGLNIIDFWEAGINLKNAGAADMTIVCNHLGIGNGGADNVGNEYGIKVHADNTHIGGTDVSDRNVISGNRETGILLNEFGGNRGSNAVVHGNYIGTSLDGMRAIPNAIGIEALAAAGSIGGPQPGSRNVISGNDYHGVQIEDEEIFVLSNYIGVAADGITALANNENGVYVSVNGAEGAIEHNIIAHNGSDGVRLSDNAPYAVEEMAIRANAIFANGQLGINLELDGDADGAVTLNDSNGDSDGGPNGLQNFPVLFSAETTGRINATLASKPGVEYTIDIYQNSACDPSGYGEGETYLTSLLVSAPNGVNNIDTLLTPAPTLGSFITVTATDENGNTSEFSNCIPVTEKTFVVNSSSFSADANIGDGRCDTDLNQAGEQCTLRAALQETNYLGGGPHRINYNLPAQTIISQMPSPLPTITTPVILDASTNGGASCATATTPTDLNVTLSGSSLSGFSPVLHLGTGSGGSEIRGLIIKNAPGDGIYMESHDNIIACNRIEDNGSNGIEIHGNNSRIGAISTYADRNVVVGNAGAGIELTDGATNNKIRGNFLGISENNVADGNSHGVRIEEGATDNTIGGSLPLRRNIISGNDAYGIKLDEAPGNTIIGNYIGTDVAGLSPVPNNWGGILNESSDQTAIGGDTTGESNLISGNGSYGVWTSGSSNTHITGNRIGTNHAGLVAIPNTDSGVLIDDSSDTVIGGSDVGEGNLISGNIGHGIHLSEADGTEIFGNSIGVNRTHSAEIPNTQSGIHVQSGEQITIGGLDQHESNIISGNNQSGISLGSDTSFGSVINNHIGTTPTGALLGNGEHGLYAESGASDTRIMLNTIAHNLRDGVRVRADVANFFISVNMIFNNGWLGIDLNGDGVTANDGNQDADAGANGLQNFPVINTANSANNNITVDLFSAPNSLFQLDVFANGSCDDSNHGQGERSLGNFLVSTDANGFVSETVVVGSFDEGEFLSLTASYIGFQRGISSGSTSEFSTCFEAENNPINANPTAITLSQQTTAHYPILQLFTLAMVVALLLATAWGHRPKSTVSKPDSGHN